MKIKERFEYIKQWLIESRIDKRWLKDFCKTNKDSECIRQMSKPIYIDLDEIDEESYALNQIDFDKLNMDEIREHFLEQSHLQKLEESKKVSSEELKQMFQKFLELQEEVSKLEQIENDLLCETELNFN
ncbi:MAG: hypothetical protein IKJ01_06670 [Lachnospiraceae bacterium]|nr:hypothetical protein [Lachnospiraceae bacterium]